MIRHLLVLIFVQIFVLNDVNGEDENFSFFLHCLPPEECQTLSDNSVKCGGTEKAPKYMCPKEEEFCNCKVIFECEELNELVISHRFNDLRTDYKSCGFDRKVPKYCCPPLTSSNFEYEE